MTTAAAREPAAVPPVPRRIGPVHWLGMTTLVRRELGRYLRGWVEDILGPAVATTLYLVVFTLALGPDRDSPAGAAVLAFMLPGVVLLPMVEMGFGMVVFSLVFDKLEGSIADILMSPLSPAELTAAYAVSGMLCGLCTGLPVLVLVVVVYGMPAADPALMALFAIASCLALGLAGVLVGLWARKWDHVGAVFGFLLIPLTFLSGVFAPVDGLPAPLRQAVQLNPIFYALDGFRGAATGVHTTPMVLSLAVLAITILALGWLSHRLIRRGWRLKA